VANPPSITRYLGVKDWYAMHYLSICSGFFQPSTINPALLTSTRVNVSCTRQVSGYTFSLSSILKTQLQLSVQELAAEVAANVKDYNTSSWVSLWYTGITTCFATILILPFTFSGTRRLNLNAFIVAGVSRLSFQAGILLLLLLFIPCTSLLSILPVQMLT